MTTTTTAATHEQIARRAFELWCENGRQPGTAADDWHAARREVDRERQHVALSDAQDAQERAEGGGASARER